ncbi:MAG: molybdopterin dinucleotide binding domain-containing protein, partial [Acidimicrobiales bacterium]
RRTLWDGGTLVSNSASLARLHPGPAAALHPSQLAALGIADGGRVRVSSTRGALELPAVPDLRVPVGVVVVPWNLPGASASVLIDAGAAATLVEVAALA